jgi:hypothetical protein
MQHEKRPYYVALLKAADVHGATHQAVMEFQVVTDKRLPQIRVGRTIIAFYHRKDMNAVANALQRHKTDTGYLRFSSPELTILDLLRYPHASGGVDHIATALSELGSRIDPRKLAAISTAFERSVVQRLGYLLGRVGYRDRTHLLHETLHQRAPLPLGRAGACASLRRATKPHARRARSNVACDRSSSAGGRSMIPALNIIAWGSVAPWAEPRSTSCISRHRCVTPKISTSSGRRAAR